MNNSSDGPPSPCIPGSTFNSTTGKTPCQSCTTCPTGKIVDKPCTTTTNTTCKTHGSKIPLILGISAGVILFLLVLLYFINKNYSN